MILGRLDHLDNFTAIDHCVDIFDVWGIVLKGGMVVGVQSL